MVSEPLRYVTVRPNRDGTNRYYWQRKGHDLVRLSDDPVERLQQAMALNRAADKNAPGTIEGSVSWCVKELKESEEWAKLAEETRSIYDRWLKQFEDWWGALPIGKAITRKVVKKLAKDYKSKPSTRRQIISALSNVVEVGREHGFTESNPCHRLRLGKGKAREHVFTEDDIKAFLDACERPEIRDTFMVLLYTAQRPIDALRLPRTAYDGEKIMLRQQKTGALVWVHCHRKLRAHIEQHMPKRGTMLITKPNGRKLPYSTFNQVFRSVLAAAGLGHLQARDLRRTAVCKLDEAGCTPSQIASVTGHSEASIHRMLQIYRPKLAGVSKIAIEKWEQNEAKV